MREEEETILGVRKFRLNGLEKHVMTNSTPASSSSDNDISLHSSLADQTLNLSAADVWEAFRNEPFDPACHQICANSHPELDEMEFSFPPLAGKSPR